MRVIGRILSVATLLVLVGLPAAAPCQTSKPAKPPITVSKETTWITEPLNPDGTVNYVAAADAWLSRGVTRENNAAILILRAVGRDVLAANVRDTIIKRLGLTDFLHANTVLIGVSKYADVAFAEADREQALADLQAAIRAVRRDPLDANVDLTHLGAFVKRNDRALDLLVEAAKGPRYYVPYVSPSNPPRTEDCLTRMNLLGWMTAADALISRGVLRARAGKFDAALRDITAVRKLGRLMQQDPLLVNAVIGMAVERSALEAMIGLATSGRLDKDQARAMLANLAETAPYPMPSDLLDPVGRFLLLGMITRWARDGLEMGTRFDPNNADPEPDVTIPGVKVDYDLLCRLINQELAKVRAADMLQTFEARDKARKAICTPTSPEVREIVKNDKYFLKSQAPLGALINRAGADDPRRLARLIHEWISSAHKYDVTGQLVETTRAWALLAKLSAALAVYHAEHGRYPDKLDALAPAIVPTVPNDQFNDKPLTYRLTDKGYILYCVGTDMKDDGGKMDEFRHGPDLVVEAK